MMLASPLLHGQPIFSSPHISDDSPLQYRPARDREAFNSLLPPPIEFIEGSSSGALAVPPGKYDPINVSPRPAKLDLPGPSKPVVSVSVKPTTTSASNPKSISLYPGGIDCTWPENFNCGNGLYNSGNTCFLNSALQCLLHTPPLLRMLITHRKDACRVDGGFCMSCSMRAVMIQSHAHQTSFSPTPITNKLQVIAKHMRKGRQEDSHEFLRYAIDALQRSCLAGYPTKIDPKLAETTWVHKVFGGRLRSRVTCHDCGHNSDTFDRILDLSVDIHKADALKDALRKFVAIDHLKGADKYKCEKCKKHVIAEKQFTLHEPPLVLTVHLKRFSPMGRKIGHHVQYDEELTLQPYMSEGHFGPIYSLYGVICHAGGGPNSGHYYAFVKSKDGHWWEMNDESVVKIGGPPLDKKTAYMLFYLRKKGQGLEAVINSAIPRPRTTLIAGMKNRKETDRGNEADDGEDMGTKIVAPIIGPLLPPQMSLAGTSDSKQQRVDGIDPQAALVKKKIEAAANSKGALKSLDDYTSENNDDEPTKSDSDANGHPPSPQRPSSPRSLLPPSSSSRSVPAVSFYGTPNPKKRKTNDDNDSQIRKLGTPRRTSIPMQSQSNGYNTASTLNPFSRSRMSNNNRRHVTRPRGV